MHSKLIIFLLFIFSEPVLAQKEGFKESYIQPLNNTLVEDKIIPNIKDSQADLELRCYFIGQWRYVNTGKIVSYKIKADRVLCETINYVTRKAADDTAYLKTKGFEVVAKNERGYSLKMTDIRSVDDKLESIISLLKLSKAEILADQSTLVEDLKHAGRIKSLNCATLEQCIFPKIIIEIKKGEKVRNFSIVPSEYYTENPSIDEFKYADYLLTLFNLFSP